MNLYDAFMSPFEKRHLSLLRKDIIPMAQGDVLEIGAGTGVNFPFYDEAKIKSLSVLDLEVNTIAMQRASEKTIFIQSDDSNLPFDDDSFDTVVETLVLCSVEDVQKMMREIKRILKPGGIFLHIDHGLPKSSALKMLFHLIAPLWHSITRSCRINKDHKPVIESSGLKTLKGGSRGKGVFYWGVSKKENCF